jgi:hypothetical protein
MKITTKRLKQIIAEEMQRLDESRYDRGSTHGQTYRAAQGFDVLAIEELTTALKGSEDLEKIATDADGAKDKVARMKIIVAGVTKLFPELVKNIQPPREFDIIKVFDDTRSEKAEQPIQKEAYTRTKKRK